MDVPPWVSALKSAELVDRLRKGNLDEDVVDKVQRSVSEHSLGDEQHDNDGDSDSDDEEDFNNKLEREAARLVLNLRRRGNVTGVAITAFAEESQRLIDAIVTATQEEIAKNLRNAGVNEDIIENCVGNVPSREPFKKLLRKDQQMNYFEKNFNLVKPVPVFLGYREDTTIDQAGNNIPVQIKTLFYYVSVKRLLVLVLNNPMLYDLIHSEKKSTDGKLRSFLDGTAVKDHPLIEEYPHTIRIILHGDDFDPSNPLGAKAGVHKTTEINMQIENLPPEENARLRSVFVLAYAYRQDLVKGRGIDQLLEPIFTEMEELESQDGAVISVNGRPYVLRATIVAVAADDLEAHEMCGLLAPGANRFCTHCLVLRADMHQNILAVGDLRTKELHGFHIQELDTKSKKFIHSSYGLERNCLLVRASKNTAFPEAAIKDGMHDVLRGVGPMEIKLALYEFCVRQKFFDVKALNNAIVKFKYGPADSKNSPSANFGDSVSVQGNYALHQSAAQTWCLLRCFPFIMVSLSVPEDNRHLKLVVLLKRICDIIFSHVISEADLQLLDELIREHHTLFLQLYPPPANEPQPQPQREVEEEEQGEDVDEDVDGDFLSEQDDNEPDSNQATTSSAQPAQKKKKVKVIRPINKHHHLIHYPDLIRKYGPVVLYWCMRFEGKHAGAVRFAKIVNNYKCLPKTFADWQQFNQCAEMLEWNTPVKQQLSVSSGKVITVGTSPYCNALCECGLNANSMIAVHKSVKIGGFVLEKGLYVHLPLTLNTLPSFGMIRSVCVHEDDLYIITEDCSVVEYDENFGAYLLDLSNEPKVIRAFLWNDLPQDQPLSSWTADKNAFYLSPRRTLIQSLMEPEHE
ncbi:hypothetical protein FOCC_FOCC009661 [Frankliniella occidentalis]|nr:hypothetical protein FOCC_FOCC009661 [Frankliniella occidentalis]